MDGIEKLRFIVSDNPPRSDGLPRPEDLLEFFPGPTPEDYKKFHDGLKKKTQARIVAEAERLRKAREPILEKRITQTGREIRNPETGTWESEDSFNFFGKRKSRSLPSVEIPPFQSIALKTEKKPRNYAAAGLLVFSGLCMAITGGIGIKSGIIKTGSPDQRGENASVPALVTETVIPPSTPQPSPTPNTPPVICGQPLPAEWKGDIIFTGNSNGKPCFTRRQ